MTYIIRSVYTTVSVETSDAGQISRIVSDRQLGDTDSILQTGYNPVDVWRWHPCRRTAPPAVSLYAGKGYVGINNKSENGEGIISFSGRLPRDAGQLLCWFRPD